MLRCLSVKKKGFKLSRNVESNTYVLWQQTANCRDQRHLVSVVRPLKKCGVSILAQLVLPGWEIVLSQQGAECGEGLQRRNLSCVVGWGGQQPASPPRPVGAELCGDQLVRSIQQEMERPCFVPCPGEGAVQTPVNQSGKSFVLCAAMLWISSRDCLWGPTPGHKFSLSPHRVTPPNGHKLLIASASTTPLIILLPTLLSSVFNAASVAGRTRPSASPSCWHFQLLGNH